ncbi:MAG: hypothetical protein JXR84_02185 [Anaerolineae bacterium]|nr:hypothetical protein [Anaerolineae bacterium]
MRCVNCDRDWPDEFKVCPLCAAPLVAGEVSPPPDFSDLRARLNRLDDPQIDALALDHFPEVQNKFGRGMRKDEKINLILEHCRHNPEAIPVLGNWLKRQPATCDPQDALACYLTRVIDENSRMQMKSSGCCVGGRSGNNRNLARCAYRLRYDPNLWLDHRGFRVMVSLCA